jgi:hypothetical protein
MGMLVNPYRYGGGGGGGSPTAADTVLLLGFNGTDGATTTTDESYAANGSPTFHNQAQIDTAQKKFGTSSLLLDGSDKIVFADDADWDLPGDWTIETFVRFNAVGGFQTLFGRANSGGSGTFMIDAINGNILRLRYEISTEGMYNQQYTWNHSTGTWYHVAADRSGGVVRLYADGTMLGKVTGITNPGTTGSTSDLTLGSLTDTGSSVVNGLNGWLDEVRITKGLARYASDSGYTVPTAEFTR